jgi:hypothetical protein
LCANAADPKARHSISLADACLAASAQRLATVLVHNAPELAALGKLVQQELPPFKWAPVSTTLRLAQTKRESRFVEAKKRCGLANGGLSDRPDPTQAASVNFSRWLTCLSLAAAAVPATLAANQALLGWNDLGMHCMDADYSVFSILPPFNTVHAQLISQGGLVTGGTGSR